MMAMAAASGEGRDSSLNLRNARRQDFCHTKRGDQTNATASRSIPGICTSGLPDRNNARSS
jgi:hypothetical protein